MAQPKLTRKPYRSSTYGSRVTPKKAAEKAREPSALVRSLLEKIASLRRVRGLQLGEMMKDAGSTQQAWSRWTYGASPKVDSLEAVARALDADLEINLKDRRLSGVRPGTTQPSEGTPESIEIAAVVDALPADKRLIILHAVHRLAHTFGPSAASAPTAVHKPKDR